MRGCHWNTLQYITVSPGGRRGARSLAPTHTVPLPHPSSPPQPGCLSGRCRDNDCRYQRWCRATTARFSHSRHAVELIELDSAAKEFADRPFVSPLPYTPHTRTTGQTHLSELQTDATPVIWTLAGKALGERGSGKVRAQAGMRPFSGQ